ncbi:hypothetical protein ABW19_dt0210546 [Dactylella cylindrospora]|nr:hypothetical protein ABW19_dt0210546 [Dactylella cylindrospora]
MFSSISQTRSISDLSRTSYVHVDDDLDDTSPDNSRVFEHQDADDEDDDPAAEDMMDQDDVGYDEYDEEIGEDDGNDDEVMEGEDAEYNDGDADGDISLIGHQGRHASSKIIEPPEFILSLSTLLESAHDVLEPLEDFEDSAEQNEPVPIGRHVLSDTQRVLHLQKLSIQIVNSLGNCAAGQNNERLDDALKLTSLMLPLYFPPPMDPSSLDLKSNAPVLREVSPPKPAPLILINWLNEKDCNPDPNDLLDVLQFDPNSALHYNFWQLLQKLALRCRLNDLKHLISSPDWYITGTPQPGARVYPRSAASNLQKAGKILIEIVTQCPASRFFPASKSDSQFGRFSRRAGSSDDETWDTSSVQWRMWRSKIARAIDEISRISHRDRNAPNSDNAEVGGTSDGLFRSRKTQKSATEDSPLIPYEIAQELRIVLQIFLGDKETIFKTSESWLEAVAGLAAFYDETGSSGDGLDWAKFSRQGTSFRSPNVYREDSAKKLAKYFHLVTDEAFPLPAVRNLQTALGSVLGGRVSVALKYLSKKSLPVASAAAELFDWAGYFSDDDNISAAKLSDSVMGILDQKAGKESVRESIASEYALALGTLGVLHEDSEAVVEGWEVGLATLRRLNTPGAQRAASKLVRSVVLEVNNPERVERLVDMCVAYGFTAERKYVSQAFAQKLLAAKQIGSSLIYFSRAECNSNVHDVMATYVRDSLRVGRICPADEELDETFQRLLTSPEELANDEILRRELSGFAALRSYFGSKDAGLYGDAAKTLMVLLLSAGEQVDGGLLHLEWESVLVTTNIAGLVYELLFSSTSNGSREWIHEYLDGSDIFSVLNVLESLFLVGGETLENIQDEFGLVIRARRTNHDLDFVEAVSELRAALARGIGNGWLREETSKSGTLIR